MRKCVFLLACASLSWAAGSPKTYTGTIGDDMCQGDHKAMNGTDPTKCTMDCAKGMKAKYSLWVGKKIYVLSDQTAPAQYAGKKVTVVGTLSDGMEGKVKVTTLAVKSIAPAK
ncbi:MAG: hypothetical protein M3N54_00280 [Acidobacteriota bacterium]|nr:hypothetical protein [Acidobacteriota bacterium]